ncbi:P-loop containing nucleoside triphosphate hydrolase [Abortiporus biennis]
MGRVDDDPLTLALAPPPNETPDQKEARLRAEAEARKISEEIDERLKAEKAALKKKPPVKVLLLGQSESGKSTTLKNFQMNYSRTTWAEELASWRTVIQLNLCRNVNAILDILNQEMAAPATLEEPDIDSDSESVISPSVDDKTPRPPLVFTEKHRVLKLQLAPLRTLQADLESRLGASSQEEKSNVQQPTYDIFKRPQEAFVRSYGWKVTLLTGRRSGEGKAEVVKRDREAEAREAADILYGCADAMKTLWLDDVVQEMLKRKKTRLDAMPGFFLGDVDRIARRDYVPSDDDVMRARLRTLGVQEHKLHLTTGPAAGTDWVIIDVGGSRTQRPAWFPYFDDCDTIIFLAPINCFDEKLAEDRRVNRLEDSFELWKMVCSSPLLAKTQIILFLNKCDLLEKKLRSGVRVKDYVPSFGKRSNDVQTVTQYFAQHFKEIFRQSSKEPRPFRVHLTSVIDTKATSVTLQVVEDSILREHMRKVHLI